MSVTAPALLPERLPETGELVQVRSRHWIAEEVVESDAPLIDVHLMKPLPEA